ncbi:hypothetical protein G6F43_003567 [Rhizopus delemar]|nr:hypothetical protein G6F43_003567 [Rhizopus delemar]
MKKEKTESMELHNLNKSERRPTWSSEYIYPETALDQHADRSDENSAGEQSHDNALRSFTPLDSPSTSKYPLETIPSNRNNRTILDRSSYTSSTCINNPESAKEMAEPQTKRSIFQKALLSLPPLAHSYKRDFWNGCFAYCHCYHLLFPSKDNRNTNRGAFLASLARDPSNSTPVQPGACAILAVFLFIGTFILNIIRIKIPKANFAAINACIILTFTMTYYPSIPQFSTYVTWEFLKPVAVAGAISLAVNYFIWPDNSIGNFLAVLQQTLGGYNAFFKEHSTAFLDCTTESNQSTLPQLHTRLQNGVLLMIDCKRAVQREVLFSRISDKDCSQLTSAVRSMRTALHGIGLSTLIKSNYLNSENNHIYFDKFKDPQIIDAFFASLENIKPICVELTETCTNATDQCLSRIANLHYHKRTNLNSILWPFPRLWASKTKKEDPESSTQKISANQIKEMLTRFDHISKCNETFERLLIPNPSNLPKNGPLYLLFLYLCHLKEHAEHITSFVALVEELEKKRTRYRFWFPHQTLSKWIHSNDMLGGSVGGDINETEHAGNDLARCTTRPENTRASDEQTVFHAAGETRKKQKKTDPDVSEPKTPIQKVFYVLYKCGKWMTDTTTFFAFKTALGVVLLAIPAWRPEDAGWYIEWRGQWAMITLVLWMLPMTGAFVFGLIDRIIGSIVGAILVTMLLVVVYEYNYVNSGMSQYDQVYTVAGKRLLMVIIGIAASGILISIPFPPTSRIELRKRLAGTIRDIGKSYGILSASIIAFMDKSLTPGQSKGFQKLAIELRRQVAEERTLLHQANYEPPLRGYFPTEHYKALIGVVDNMSDLVINMGSSLGNIRPEWKKQIATVLKKERMEYLSSILSIFKLTSSTLYAKTSLPPYILSPIDCRERFVNLLERKIMIEAKDIANSSFPFYSSYLMNGLVLVDELQVLLSITEELVGIEDPEQWLLSRA